MLHLFLSYELKRFISVSLFTIIYIFLYPNLYKNVFKEKSLRNNEF